MNATCYQAIRVLAVLGGLLGCTSLARAGDATAVRVKYTSGDTQLSTLHNGVKFFGNRTYIIQNVPGEMDGLSFTVRGIGKPSDVNMDVPEGVTVYVMVPAGTQDLSKAGWSKIDDAEFTDKSHSHLNIYKRTFTKQAAQTISSTSRVGVAVAAKSIELSGNPKPADNQSGATPLHADTNPDTTPTSGPTTHPVLPQATIKALEIYETDSGLMLGQTSETTLTLTPSDKPKLVTIRFVTPIGSQMSLARDDALRFIHVTYPNWYVDKAEITFEDKYVAHDGGSIGAAIGTMILSVIQGFTIDDNAAITGDISANGKVRAIGGVAAKIRGAAASKCTLVAVPLENYDQLADAATYYGPTILSDVQVIGIANLADAIATVRADREDKLSQAITLFAEVQQDMKGKPGYLKRPESAAKLTKILELAPQHLSAKILLAIAQAKVPATLSPVASRYYTFLAAGNMIDVLKERGDTKTGHQVPSASIHAGLNDLQKLRPMADPQVRPLIDAWSRFIEAWSNMQQGVGSQRSVESQRQLLLDEMAKEQADGDLMQKMLKEGI